MKFTLGSQTSDDLNVTLRSTPKPLQSGVDSRMENIPGKVGGYDFGSDLEPLVFELNCEIQGSSESDLQDKARTLAEHLFDDQGQPRELELSFSDEPNKYWTVRYDSGRGELFERIVGGTVGQFTLPLVAEDPRAHEAEETTSASITSSGGTLPVTNSGNVKTPVKLKITNNGSTTINGFTIKRS